MSPLRWSSVELQCIALLVVPHVAVAQAERSRDTGATTSVFVSDAQSGAPLAGALVRDSLTGNQAATGADGMAKISAVGAVGPFYILAISKIGFRPQTLRLDTAGVRDAKTVIFAELVQLPARIAVLDPVLTSATSSTLSKNMQGFESRRRSPALRGKFVTPQELRTKWPADDLHDVFLNDGLIPIANIGRRVLQCPVAYFVNGSRWHDIPSQTDAYEAIEFYPSALMAPVDIIGNLAFDVHYCGIYVLWLRESP